MVTRSTLVCPSRALPFSSFVLRYLPFTAPTTLLFLFDLTHRFPTFSNFTWYDTCLYGLSLLQGLLFWSSLLILASRWQGIARVTIALFGVFVATLSLGEQSYFFQLYGTYFNRDALFFGATFSDSVQRLLLTDLRGFLLAHRLPLLTAFIVAITAHWMPQPSTKVERTARWTLLPALLSMMFLPCSFRGIQASSPDRLYLHALGGLIEARTIRDDASKHTLLGARTPEYIPEIVARPARPRNLIFLLTESVRADAVCSRYDPECKKTPFSNKEIPGRIALPQLRSNDSVTTISVAVSLTGVAPDANHDEMHRAPTLWEYGRTAGYDTAYWTSQDLRSVHSDLFMREIGARLQLQGRDLDPGCSFDVGADDLLLAHRIEEELPKLHEPFVAVIQLANTHFPYRIDENDQPFQPAENTKDPAKNSWYFNYYQNAVYRQDKAVGAILRTIRNSTFSDKTILVFTSDHGEAFREHGQLAHTLSVYDEEIHVPGWIDAPENTLGSDERTLLEHNAKNLLWHIDLLPTFLDLLGVYDAPELQRFRRRMEGVSILRTMPIDRAIPLTNCAAAWGCPFRNWGMMRGPWKLEARAWDPDWHCWNVLNDPKEQNDLGSNACGDLAAQALRRFKEKPGGS